MLAPLEKEVAEEIPEYSKLEFSFRKRWCCNRFFRIVFLFQFSLYISIWFYYAPFFALTFNFTVPFLREKFGDYGEKIVVGEMSDEQKDFVNSIISNSDSSFDEPSLPEMLKMIDDTPLVGDGWQ